MTYHGCLIEICILWKNVVIGIVLLIIQEFE